jgi:hypothetical protein
MNRAPDDRLADKPVCGRCKAELLPGHPVVLDDQNLHADLLALAPDFETAANELAMISLSCGNRHWFVDHGPKPLPDARVLEGSAGEELLKERMVRHAIGAEQMWEGLIIPSDHSWHDGATVLAQAPLKTHLEDGMAIDSGTQARIDELRALARTARVARSHKDRARLYGQMIGRCASCHQDTRR